MALQTQLGDSLLAIGKVVGTAVSTLNALSNLTPGGALLKRRATTAIASRLAWGVVPLVAAGAVFWGTRAWQRRDAARKTAASVAHLPVRDVAPPKDRVDESSWESFPASDPPAASPSRTTPKAP